jgi:ApbE superfamily uncharacterized protein (UPF0280 family)
VGFLDRLRPVPLMRLGVDAGKFRIQLQLPEEHADEGRTAVLRRWEQVESYLLRNPEFKEAQGPVEPEEDAPSLVRAMEDASMAVGIPPIDALPGAFVDVVGRDLQLSCREATITCEGVSFVIGAGGRTFVADSVPTAEGNVIGIRVDSRDPYAVFSSIGRVRGSIDDGNARAIAVVSEQGALAEAVGVAISNALRKKTRLKKVLQVAQRIPEVLGGAVFVDHEIGVWGDIEIVTPPLDSS